MRGWARSLALAVRQANRQHTHPASHVRIRLCLQLLASSLFGLGPPSQQKQPKLPSVRRSLTPPPPSQRCPLLVGGGACCLGMEARGDKEEESAKPSQ